MYRGRFPVFSAVPMLLVEEILAPLLVALPNQAHQLPRSVQRERTRAPLQLEARFFRRAIALAVVAGVAACDQILPGRAPAARARHHVVERQLRRGKRRAAELARVAVAQQDVLARKSAALLRDMPVAEQPDHGRHLDG